MKEITPDERKKRIEDEGMKAALEGLSISDNPYLVLGNKYKVYAGYWDKGFNNKNSILIGEE